MTGPAAEVRNGWTLLRHPAFAEPLAALTAEVKRLRSEDPAGFASHPNAKLLKRILTLIFDEMPADPDAPEYRLGNTLGPRHRHWRRAKFLGRFRLFFRFDSRSRIIVYGWINDENSLRKEGSRSDPYSLFARRLAAGDPPDAWSDLAHSAAAGQTRPPPER